MKQLFNNLSPKVGFAAGMAVSVLLLFSIGFFVLLWLVLSKNFGNETVSQNTQKVQISPPAPSVPAKPKDIQIAAVTDKDHIRGNPDAKISVIEFSDTECPFCKRFHPTMKQVVDFYGDKVNWVYRHFPLDSLHRKARKEAEATECAGEQGKFWEYTDRLFDITPSNDGLQESQLTKIAEDIGLNISKFDSCLNSSKFAGHVADERAQAISAGGSGTPYSVIVSGSQKIPLSGAVPFSQIKSIIDPML